MQWFEFVFSSVTRDHGVTFSSLNMSDIAVTVTDIVTLEPALDPGTIILDLSYGIRGPCDIKLSYKLVTANIV